MRYIRNDDQEADISGEVVFSSQKDLEKFKTWLVICGISEDEFAWSGDEIKKLREIVYEEEEHIVDEYLKLGL